MTEASLKIGAIGVMTQQTATISQASSPGQSPEHWGTKSFSSAAITFLVVVLLAVLIWRFLLQSIRLNLGIRVMIYLSEATAAVGLSLVVSYFDVFKKATYVPTPNYQPDWHVLFWASAWAALVGYYFVVKLAGIYTKEGEEFKSKQLQSDLDKTVAALDSIGRQRSLLVKITSFARNMVNTKITRLCSLVSSNSVSTKQLVDHLNPGLQLRSNVKSIHEFFKSPDNLNVNLRLALWMKANADGDHPERMEIAYSWDGHKEDCFSNKSSNRMKLLDPLGTLSEIVKFYSSPAQAIKIIPDCVSASRKQEFEFFYPEQKHKVGSMILYKHVFNAQSHPVAVVLLLVSSLQNQFQREDEEQFRTFLDEMLTRVEMEWVLLQLTQKLDQAKEAA